MRFHGTGLRIVGIVAVLLVVCPFAAFGNASIEGMVVDFYGQPLEGAAVELKGVEVPRIPIVRASDSNGRYQIKDLDGGRYELTVTFRGFRREIVPVQLFADEVKHQITGLEVGRVTDAEPIYISGVVQSKGKPLPDAVVKVTNAFNERKSVTTTTDKSGRYKMEILDGGQYIITAFRPGYKAGIVTKIFDRFLVTKSPRAHRVNLSLIKSSAR